MTPQNRTYSYCLLTYNQSDTVAEAVRSALAQDCAPMQIVISDDCSKDDTFLEIEKAVQGYDGPHSVIVNRNDVNLGLVGNIHRVHELSSGDVIIAAAGDDISLPHRSRRIMETFDAENPLLVCSHAFVLGPDGSELSGAFHKIPFYQTWTLDTIAVSSSLYIGATGAWARELYSRYGPLDADTYEDLVLGFRAALENRVSVIPEKLVYYRLGNGITSAAGYSADPATFKKHRARSFVVLAAVLAQRQRDAMTFGLDAGSPAGRALRAAKIRAEIAQCFYDGKTGALLWHGLRHPMITLKFIFSEKNRHRRFHRTLKKRARMAAA